MSYKPERPVTSEKIKALLNEKFREREKMMGTIPWKRTFRKSLPKTKCQMRGYVACSGSHYVAAIAVSDDEDSRLLRTYLLSGFFGSEAKATASVKTEADQLSVLEVMFADD